MSTIHLLGSEGFIGRAIQRVDHGHDIRLWTHTKYTSDSFFNLLDSTTWDSLISHKPTHVILLSWPGLPNYHETFHITKNLPASIELLEQLIDAGLRRIVVAGTCYEYGLQNGPLREDQHADPVNCYGIAKDCLRRVVSAKCANTSVDWAWLRIFYPYGKGQSPSSFIPSLIQSINLGEKYFHMSSGRQLRDFVHVDKIAQQLITLATDSEASGIFNGGSGQPQSLLEIAEQTIQAYGSTIRLKRGAFPERSDEPLAFWAQMDKFRAL
jgi:nucleoside-diphosphate-sugar epimerase